MLVDVILPIYNPNEKIYEAISSVLNQTYTKWHLFIIDDASPTKPLADLRHKFCDCNSITFLLNEKNQRAAACRNKAISLGKGELIAFIDQDDVWLPEKLAKQVDILIEQNLDAVHGNLIFIDMNGKQILSNKAKKENESRQNINWQLMTQQELAKQVYFRPNIRLISSLVKRSVFEVIGGFKAEYFGGEDELFWFELARIGKIGFINDILIMRRVHANNTFSVFSRLRLLGYIKALKDLQRKYQFLKTKEYRDKYSEKIHAYVKRSFREREYGVALIYFFRWFIQNPSYLLKMIASKKKDK